MSLPKWSFTFRRRDNDEIPDTILGEPIYSVDETGATFDGALKRARERVARRSRLSADLLYCVGAAAKNYDASQICASYKEKRR